MRLSVRLFVCLSVCLYVCMCASMHACMCVSASVCMYIRMFVTFFLTSDLLHLESNIYVGLLAYMRTHARQHLKLEVRHKNSHGRIHTHTKRTDTRTQARTYMYARMYLQADTHLYPYTHSDVRMRIYTYSAYPDQTPYIVASYQDSTVCFYNNLLLLNKKNHSTSL